MTYVFEVSEAEYPNNVVGTPTTGGSMIAGTYYYRVSAINPNGTETFAGPQSNAVTIAVEDGKVGLTWNAVYGCTYKVYRRTSLQTWTDGAAHYLGTASQPAYTDSAASASAGAPMWHQSDALVSMPESSSAELGRIPIINAKEVVQALGSKSKEQRVTILESGTASTAINHKNQLLWAAQVGVPVKLVITAFGQTIVSDYYFIEDVSSLIAAGTGGTDDVWLTIDVTFVED